MEYWDLIAKHLSGNATNEEQDKLRDWIKFTPENETLFKEAKAIWNSSGNLYADRDFEPNKEWAKLKAKIDITAPKRNDVTVRRLTWLKVAAVIVIVLVSGVFLKIHFMGDESSVIDELQYVQENTIDSASVIYLPDSSRVILNKNSSLSYAKNFADTARITYLIGEAYFEVTKSEKRFMIYAGGTQITVVGTSFNVKAREEEDEVEVVVVEGKVSFSDQKNPNEGTTLEAGEKVTFSKSGSEYKKSKSSGTDLWWKKLDLEDRAKKIIRKLKNN